VQAAAGESVTARIPVADRRLAHWDGGWVLEPGAFDLAIGASVAETPLALAWEAGA
jgi:beta-glucosidase